MALIDELARKVHRDEDGAVGWLLIGMILGAILIVVLIIKLLIPGD
jgi:hypothetical protein